MRPDNGFRIAAARGEQPHEGVEHVPVAQIPRFPGAAVHEPIVMFRGPYNPRVLRGVEEGFAVTLNISEPPVEQRAQFREHSLFTRRLIEMERGAAVASRIILPRGETSICLPQQVRPSAFPGQPWHRRPPHADRVLLQE